MSEPFLERLSRFTPDAGGLDRDALLFAAGRGSARPNRGWKALTGLLAGTQMLSLVLLFHGTTPQAVGFREAVADVPVPPAVLEPANPGVSSARHALLDATTERPPADDVDFIDRGPPLHAGDLQRASLLN